MLWDHAKAYLKAHHADGQQFSAMAAPYGMRLMCTDEATQEERIAGLRPQPDRLRQILAKLITVDEMAETATPQTITTGLLESLRSLSKVSQSRWKRLRRSGGAMEMMRSTTA